MYQALSWEGAGSEASIGVLLIHLQGNGRYTHSFLACVPIGPDQFNLLFHGLILPKYESVGRQKNNNKNMNLINIDL